MCYVPSKSCLEGQKISIVIDDGVKKAKRGGRQGVCKVSAGN